MFSTVTLNPCIDKTVTINGFQKGKLNRIIDSKSQPAGKGINASIVYNNLGGDTFCTGINYLSNRNVLEDFLNEKNIKNDFYTVPGELRTNLKVFDTEKNEITEINAGGYKVPIDYEVNLLNKIVKAAETSNTMLLGGSVPKGVRKDIYAKIIHLVKQMNTKVVLDADGDLFKNAVNSKPYMIKPNAYELELYTGKKQTCHKDMVNVVRREFVQNGISLVCVSLGADGAIIVDENKAFYASGLKVQVKGTVGAGDSMVAGIVYGMNKGMQLKDLLRSGVACATSSIAKEGTELCDNAGYQEYFKLVKIREIAI